MPALRGRTESFRRSFYDTTLPYWLRIASPPSSHHPPRRRGVPNRQRRRLRVGRLQRLLRADLYPCVGLRTILARLFPDLEKEMRRVDLKHQQRPNGGVNNRTEVPSPPHPTGEHPATDGHASCILKAYREALNHPDDSFLKEYWPYIQRAVEYLVARDALRLGRRARRHARGCPAEYLRRGAARRHYVHLGLLSRGAAGRRRVKMAIGRTPGRPTAFTPSSSEAGRTSSNAAGTESISSRTCPIISRGTQQTRSEYARVGEIGPGCMADQLIGQWWAHQLGLGYLLPKEKVRTAPRSIFKYNWLTGIAGFKQSRGLSATATRACWSAPGQGRPPRNGDALFRRGVDGHRISGGGRHDLRGMIERCYHRPRCPRSLRRHRPPAHPAQPVERDRMRRPLRPGHVEWSPPLAVSGYESTARREPALSPRPMPADFHSPSPARKDGAACGRCKTTTGSE